ncbi:proline-rich receptor-like protein kinase PERK10 [Vigna angularis]|uniref:proline-rich receptor-like protein kinase PERK10 n=1 Tax=Phaseolus angularis TaxID=3914 RepID=UPI0022B4D363|nr:proline-rich receptor-like protein kinase PERK10 [Vigna angularis]
MKPSAATATSTATVHLPREIRRRPHHQQLPPLPCRRQPPRSPPSNPRAPPPFAKWPPPSKPPNLATTAPQPWQFLPRRHLLLHCEAAIRERPPSSSSSRQRTSPSSSLYQNREFVFASPQKSRIPSRRSTTSSILLNTPRFTLLTISTAPPRSRHHHHRETYSLLSPPLTQPSTPTQRFHRPRASPPSQHPKRPPPALRKSKQRNPQRATLRFAAQAEAEGEALFPNLLKP